MRSGASWNLQNSGGNSFQDLGPALGAVWYIDRSENLRSDGGEVTGRGRERVKEEQCGEDT